MRISKLLVCFGVISFVLAILIAGSSLAYMSAHNTTGSPVEAAFCASFLSFSAAAFGIGSKWG